MASDRPTLPADSERVLRVAGRSLRFGDFELLTSTGELLHHAGRGATPVKLQPQPAKVLLYLAERPGSLVTRAELQQHLWGENHFVDHEQGLNYCIRAVRRALDDDASSPRYLETVPRRGYRFREAVRVHDASQRVGEAQSRSLLRLARPTSGGRRAREVRFSFLLVAIAIISLALHLALSAGWLGRPAPPKLAVLPFDDHTGSQASGALAGGLTDELIAGLASHHPDRLGVVGRTSSLAFADTRLTAAQIGRELDADYLLTGGIQMTGAATRISIQLIRVSDDTNLWAEIYDRPAEDTDWDTWVQAVASEVADRLAPAST